MNKNKYVKVFDDNASLYDKYRPTYPLELVNDLIDLSKIIESDKILEIGCGTGQLTMDFITKGYEVIAIEKGENLSRIASNKLAKYGLGKIINSTFEEWIPSEKFKLIISAQAFHWIDKEKGIDKMLKLLEDKGAIGLIWSVDKSQETEFWRETSKVYGKFLPKKKGRKSMGETVDEHWEYFNESNELVDLKKRHYKWSKVYTKEEYLGLLSTFSPQMSIESNNRAKFFKEIEYIIEKMNNQVLKYYETILLFATKRS